MEEGSLNTDLTSAVILAGGRGSRLGGREKGEISISGERLIDLVVRGAREAGCREIVIAGDVSSRGAVTVREEPPFGGPVAGLAAALDQATGEWILLLGCDLPRAGELCGLIVDEAGSLSSRADGIVVVDRGRHQWLSGLYRRSSLESSLASLGESSGASLQALLGSLDLVEIADPGGLSRDIDTPDDLAAAQRKDAP